MNHHNYSSLPDIDEYIMYNEYKILPKILILSLSLIVFNVSLGVYFRCFNSYFNAIKLIIYYIGSIMMIIH